MAKQGKTQIEQAPRPLRAVIYARVSTDDPAQAGSCDTQIARCEQYCALKGYTIIDRFKDEGVSGKTMHRPAWLEVEKLLNHDLADIVVSTALDRMTRTIEGFLKFVREILERNHKGFSTIQEDINTESAAGRMFFYLLLVFAQFQREQTSEKTRGARLSRASQGYHPTRSPFGTMPGPVKGVPVPDPERWPWLLRIFELAAKGHPDHHILAVLGEHNVTTVTGAQMGKTTLRNVIESRFYLGEVFSDGQWFPAKHQCRIDPKLWQSAQRARKAKPGPPQLDYTYLLDGLVATSHYTVTHPSKLAGQPCPYRTRKVRGRGGKPYYEYIRGDRLEKHGGLQVKASDDLAGTLPPYLNAQQLDGMVVEWLLNAAKTGELQRGLAAALKAAASRLDHHLKDRQLLEQQHSKLLHQQEKLNQKVVAYALADNDSAIPALNAQLAELSTRLEELASKLAVYDTVIRELRQAELENKEVADHVALIEKAYAGGHMEPVRNLIRVLVHSVDVRIDGITVSIYAMPGKAVYESGLKAALASHSPKLLRA